MEQITCIDPEVAAEDNPVADSLEIEEGVGSFEPDEGEAVGSLEQGEGLVVRTVVHMLQEEDIQPEEESAD